MNIVDVTMLKTKRRWALLICGALGMLDAGLVTDLIGLSIGGGLFLFQRNVLKLTDLAHGKG